MKKLALVTQSSLGRAAIGFVGTAAVLLGTPLFSPDASAAARDPDAIVIPENSVAA